MASELIVQTLKGPTSGSNANKIIVPSGHTLDASGGTLVPSAGQVVQMTSRVDTTTSSGTTSTSFVSSGVYVTITPKFANSKIFVQFIGGSYTSGQGVYTIYRGLTSLETVSQAQVGNGTVYSPATVAVFDEPNTTSAVTYTVYYKAVSGNVYWPPGSNDTTQCVAWEIAQ
jgi:hypothetical protein